MVSLLQLVGWMCAAGLSNVFAKHVAAKLVGGIGVVTAKHKLLFKCYLPIAVLLNAMIPLTAVRLFLRTIVLPSTVLQPPAPHHSTRWEDVAIPGKVGAHVTIAASLFRIRDESTSQRSDDDELGARSVAPWVVFFNPNGAFKEQVRFLQLRLELRPASEHPTSTRLPVCLRA